MSVKDQPAPQVLVQLADAVEQLASEHGLFLCVGCGKCVAVCPMAEIFEDFGYEVSPRGVIEWALLGLDLQDHVGPWFCLTCDQCTKICPAGVHFRDFVEEIRQVIIAAGDTQHAVFCEDCGQFLWPKHTVEYLTGVLGEEAAEYLTACPKCRQIDFGDKLRALRPGIGVQLAKGGVER